MRKIFAALLCLSLLFGTASCGIGSKDREDGKMTVVMVTDEQGVEDGTLNEVAFEGLKRAMKNLGIRAEVLESASPEDYQKNIESAAIGGAAMIISVGCQLEAAMEETAGRYPGVKFVLIDGTSSNGINLLSLSFEDQQSAFLAGVAAGMTTASDVVGFIGGTKHSSVQRQEYGFRAGVQAVNPDASIVAEYAGTMNDPELWKQLALEQREQGADVIYQVAGRTGIGVIQAAAEYRESQRVLREEAEALQQEGGPEVVIGFGSQAEVLEGTEHSDSIEGRFWVIGSMEDQSFLSEDDVLCSTLKRVDHAIYLAIEDLTRGKFESEVRTFGMDLEGVDYSDEAENLPPDIEQVMRQFREQIISGDLVIPVDKKNLADFKLPEE